jgi:high-affinity iron transporter
LEALLVLAALLTFLGKSGNVEKQKVVWVGAGIGIALSALVAFIVEAFFSTAAAGSNRELIEGITGLVAAFMLFYMSYWLHNKSQAGAWQHYIKSKATSAIATGSAFSLGLLAFLAVFREGSETAILYLGIAPSIALSDLLIGLGIGTGLLGIIAALILVVGVKLPMRPFFQVASLLVFYIGFKFVGTGIHSLQVAQTLPAHSENWLLSVDFFGIYPTWETSLAQLALLGMVVVLLVVSKRQERKSKQVQVETQPVVATTEVVQQLDSTTTPTTPSQPIKA